jgi:hypothetical protein
VLGGGGRVIPKSGLAAFVFVKLKVAKDAD